MYDTSRQLTRMSRWRSLGIIVTVVSSLGFANGQSDGLRSNNEPSKPRANLIEATREYKASSQDLLRFQEDEIRKASEKLEPLRQLAAEGLIAKNELLESEQSLTVLRAKLESTRQQIGDSDRLIAEIQAAEELRKTQSLQAAGLAARYRSLNTPTIFRYDGAVNWSLANLAGIEGFFTARFGRSLPTSAVGQSATHDRLGWDHRNSVDVSLHPDSVEGKELIRYLQSAGIPFLAFRAAIPGVATGPHIHIGSPSHRLASAV